MKNERLPSHREAFVSVTVTSVLAEYAVVSLSLMIVLVELRFLFILMSVKINVLVYRTEVTEME